jgi:aminoglycoside phosphotransferase (APT) family kinase protein
VPQLQYVSPKHGYFTMEYLGAGWQNWKRMLLDCRSEPWIAQEVSGLLGKIHARSASDPEARERFQTLTNFEQLRIEPYLLATARRHPRLKAVLEAEAARLRAERSVLTHGDFSPKNILVSPQRVVVLDCECAWYGDAAFDIAFLLNHIFLKSAAARHGHLAADDRVDLVLLRCCTLCRTSRGKHIRAGAKCLAVVADADAGQGGWKIAGRVPD